MEIENEITIATTTAAKWQGSATSQSQCYLPQC